ncbi:hypothetical protein ALNOE001_04420 [Candidatus Methanobinarius endosymbioticus]|uniref:DUF3467 domain-containing protein n=1 Tax=Candidatus Methanobinarius endosymbioticus TaxID=2006182 RepID=A0A366MFF4_9EURY|nr:hypothetical protein ALNOE001_04420 [Candidatus Methanobinarius endosymbioticus]
MKEGNNENIETENLTIIPPNTPEIYATIGASFSTPFNIRLLLFNDEIVKSEEYLVERHIPTVRNAKCELVLHPQVAESIANLLLKEVEKYKKDFCEPVENSSN